MNISTSESNTIVMTSRKPWHAPVIVLERPLKADAQGEAPGADPVPGGFLGPFGTSGSGGQCSP